MESISPHSQPPRAEVLDSLRSLEPFQPFSDAELADLLPRCTIREEGPGRTLIAEGEPSDQRVYFVLEGRVSVFVNDRYILTLKRRGDIFGEMSLVSDESRSATVRTDETTRLLVISSALDMAERADRHYKLRYYFTRMFGAIMAGKLRVTSERAKLYEEAIVHSQRMEAHNLDLEERIAHNLRRIRLYSHLVDSATDAILISDLAGTVEQANPAMQQGFGLAPEAVRGRHLRELLGLPAEGPRSWEAIAADAWRAGWSGEVAVEAGRRTSIPADGSVSLVRDRDGAPLAYSVVLRDIRERKAYQERILGQQRELERAYRELQALDRLKDRFLSRVSHELRTPLTGVLASLELLQLGMVEPEEQGEYVEMVSREAERLADRVDKLLAMAKLESGQWPLEPGPLDLDTLVAAEVAAARQRAGTGPVAVEWAAETPLRPVAADGDKLRLAVRQLLDNALAFTGRGGVRVTLAQEAGHSRIRVADTGPGLAPGTARGLFDKFSQIEHDDTDPDKGLGLGLPLCDLIVRAHAGRVDAENVPGGGACFTITLPLQEAATTGLSVVSPEPAT